MSSSDHYTLNYWVIGDDPETIEDIKISNDSTIAGLRDAIARKTGADHGTMTLWRVSITEEKLETLHDVKTGSDIHGATHMVNMSPLLKHFPIPPTVGILNVVVEPYGHHKRQRVTAELEEVLSPSPLCEFWRLTWKADIWANFILTLHHVERDKDNPCSSHIRVPETCWKLRVQPWITDILGCDDASSFMIREEYMEALDALIQYYRSGKDIIPNSMEDEYADRDVWNPTTIVNPFDSLKSGERLREGGFVVLGHPGIGKTAWLYVVLVFRLQRGLPTILQFRPGKLFYFSGSGVQEFSYQENSSPTPLRDTIDSSTWCLVDTNPTLKTVPTFVTLLRTFIVQASSPRDAHTKWDSKYGSTVIRYYMAPWSISEIITGRGLQSPPSIFKWFLSDIIKVEWAITVASADQLRKILMIVLDHVPKEISTKHVLVLPGDDRQKFTACIPTQYLCDIVINAIAMSRKDAVNYLYEMFIRVPPTRSSGGNLLDYNLHDVFRNGGQWGLFTMERSKVTGKLNSHWKTSNDSITPEDSKTLHDSKIQEDLNYKTYLRIGLQDRSVSYDNTRLGDNVSYKAPEMCCFRQGESLKLADKYYYPLNRNQPTLDAFIYRAADGSALVLQATVAHSKRRGVLAGFAWLKTLGVRTYDFIVVGPPLSVTFDLAVPNDVAGNIRCVYYLPLKRLFCTR